MNSELECDCGSSNRKEIELRNIENKIVENSEVLRIETMYSHTSVVQFKWNHYGNQRRFFLSYPEMNYSKFTTEIYNLRPNFSDAISYIDLHGDCILLLSEMEFQGMIKHFQSKTGIWLPKEIEIHSTVSGKPVLSTSLSKSVHDNIYCNICAALVCGIRYVCVVCKNYNLCEMCEKNSMHGHHPLLRLATPNTLKDFPEVNKLYFISRERCPSDASTISNTSTKKDGFIQNIANISNNEPLPQNSSTTFVEHLKNIGEIGSQLRQVLYNYGYEESNKNESIFLSSRINQQSNDQLTESNANLEAIFNGPFNQTLSKSTETINNAQQQKMESQEHQEQEQEQRQPTTDQYSPQPISMQLFVDAAAELATTTERIATGLSLNMLGAAKELLNWSRTSTDAANTIGSIVLNDVKTKIDLITDQIDPIIVELQEKCKVGVDNACQTERNGLDESVLQYSTYNFCNTSANLTLSTESENSPQAKREKNEGESNEDEEEFDDEEENEYEEEVPSESSADQDRSFQEVCQLIDGVVFAENHETSGNNSTIVSSLTNLDISSGTVSLSSPSNQQRQQENEEESVEAKSCSDGSDNEQGWSFVQKPPSKKLCKFFERINIKEIDRALALKNIPRRKYDRKAILCLGQAEKIKLPSLVASCPCLLSISLNKSNETTGEINSESNATKANNCEDGDDTLSTQDSNSSIDSTSAVETSNNSIYPNLKYSINQQLTESEAENYELEKCYAGIPYYPQKKPHSKICYVKHPDPVVQKTVDWLHDMGYDNCNGWLTGLSQKYHGDFEKIMDAISQDPLYMARLAD